MYELTCEANHPGNTLVILPFMGHMYFKQNPETGFCIKTQRRFNLGHLFHQTIDGQNNGPPPVEFNIKPAPAWFGVDGKWLLVSWKTFAPCPYFVAEHLWPRLYAAILWVQRRMRRALARRRLGPLSEFVRLARAPDSRLPSDVVDKIIEATVA